MDKLRIRIHKFGQRVVENSQFVSVLIQQKLMRARVCMLDHSYFYNHFCLFPRRVSFSLILVKPEFMNSLQPIDKISNMCGYSRRALSESTIYTFVDLVFSSLLVRIGTNSSKWCTAFNCYIFSSSINNSACVYPLSGIHRLVSHRIASHRINN